MTGALTIHLEARGEGELVARYTNTGAAPLALTFWWNRSMRVLDDRGATMAPSEGPILPCGAGEEWEVLAPGASIERAEPFACTQPAGRTEKIGWSYEHLPAGRYQVTVVYQAPPAHGFTQAEPHPAQFIGVVESNTVSVQIAPRKRTRGILGRLFG